MDCIYTDPVNLGTGKMPDWEYSKSACLFAQSEIPLTLIQSGNSEEFYMNKTISYGDVLVLTFLTIFLVFGIVKFLTDFFIPKLVNFRRK
jgi:hypothetical protein